MDLTLDGRRPARWTLILGDNGVGKTTLLQCLAWMRLEPGRYDPLLFNEENDFLIRLRPRLRRGDLDLSANLLVGTTLSPINDRIKQSDSRGRSVKLRLSIEFAPPDSDHPEGDISRKNKNRRGRFEKSLIVAYGADRHLGSQNLTNPELEDPIGARLAGRTELYDVEEMLSNLHHASETEENPDRIQDQRDLKHLKEVLTKILPEDVDPDAIEIFAADRLGRGGPSGVSLDTFTGLVPFSELSLGYQTTLAWTADFAWRLLKNSPNSSNPFAEPAVVLIDEIDLHLHPRWQQDIMKTLGEILPGTQFIATSHSPLMAQVAEDANFVLLNKRQEERDVEIVNDPEVVRGWRVDQILTSELFGGLGARSPEIELLFDRRDELLSKRSLSIDEDAELARLRTEIEKLPTAAFGGDQAAMTYIRETSALLRRHRNSGE